MINFGILLRILFLLFVIYVIFEVIRKILGGSLGFEELVTVLLVANLGYLYKLNSKLSGHLGWHKGMESANK